MEETMNILLSSACNEPDWAQFWPSMIATFVGFVLALLGEFAFEKIKSQCNAKSLLVRIKTELGEIRNELNNWHDALIGCQPLKTPVWDEAINVGQVSLLGKEERKEFFKIYKQIQGFNSWSEEQTKYYFGHNGNLNPAISFELEKEKASLLEQLCKIKGV